MAVNSNRQEQDQTPTSTASPTYLIILKLMSKRRTWVLLFLFVYTILLSSSWNLLQSVLSWYDAAVTTSPSSSTGWPAIYASVALGVIFGLLSMAAALAVAIPATVVTWISVLVLLTFFGKPRKSLVVEGKKLTAEITRTVGKILIKEGNLVAAVCAVLGYFLLVRNGGKD
ncbi:uncharacterized protein LOC111899900 [Lactuca sativa]|uniref:Pyrroline-5-carboxylate reductase n=1 Tax=Lactuca sativa TaxID=4236 RepID=A0A9R1XK86_LACSA|nr:uncharacterized protein LOC111899900 [Lactuca sativa]KAJ0212869.1 hypothetical protein LSAT_V11C400183000 [Lactuca sativa]